MSDAPLMTLRFSLPWAPSANAYWFHTVMGGKFKKAQARVLLSDRGRNYRVAVLDSVRSQKVPENALKGRLAMSIVAYPPDRRARDLDNLLKGLLDSLVAAQIISDDSHIDDLRICRGPVRHDGVIALEVRELGIDRETQAHFELPQAQASAPPF